MMKAATPDSKTFMALLHRELKKPHLHFAARNILCFELQYYVLHDPRAKVDTSIT